MSTVDRICAPAPAGTVNVGDEILIAHVGMQLVAEVNSYDDRPDDVWIVYFDNEESTYENKARDKSGGNHRRRLVMKTLKPMRRDETVLIVRGSAGAADTMRARLEREQEERWHAAAERRDRAQMHQERERA